MIPSEVYGREGERYPVSSSRVSRFSSLLFLPLAAVLVVLSGPVHAEDELTLQARVDKTEVAVGEKFLFSVTISGPMQGSPELKMGSFEGFEVVSTAQSQQVELRGRKMEQTLVLTYTLAAKAPGARALKPVRVEYQGRVYDTQPIEIHVKEGPVHSERPPLEGGFIL